MQSNSPKIKLKRGRWWRSDGDITASSSTAAQAFHNWHALRSRANRPSRGLADWDHLIRLEEELRSAVASIKEAEKRIEGLLKERDCLIEESVELIAEKRDRLRQEALARSEQEIDLEKSKIDILRLEKGWHATSVELIACKRALRALGGDWPPAVGQPSTEPCYVENHDRRLALLREIGGDAIFVNGKWRFTRVGALARVEEAAGRNRCSEKDIRDDLRLAAEIEERRRIEGIPRA